MIQVVIVSMNTSTTCVKIIFCFIATKSTVITKEQLKKLADNLNGQWTKLCPKLGITKDDESEIKKKFKEEKGRLVHIQFMYKVYWATVFRDWAKNSSNT